MGGFTVAESTGYFGVRLLLMLLFPLILPASLIYYIVILFKVGPKSIFPSIVIAAILSFIFLCTASWSLVTLPAQGYYDYVKKNVNIREIQKWLVNHEQPGYELMKGDGTKQDWVPDNHWPECIKSLHPTRGVLIFESEGKRYVKICHAVDIELSIGLCVMEEPMDIPEYVDDFSERRIKLSDNAFVWAGD